MAQRLTRLRDGYRVCTVGGMRTRSNTRIAGSVRADWVGRMFEYKGPYTVFAELPDGSVIQVWHIRNEWQPDELSRRQRYGYVIVSAGNDGAHGWRYEGDDICIGCGAGIDVMDAARTLASFLSASAEAYQYGPDSDNRDLFPSHVMGWAYMNSGDIAMLSLDADAWT